MELMSPAGNKEAFFAAVENGPDSIYLGLSLFNARRPAKNFSFEELPELIEFAHSKNVKIYITLNIDLKNYELPDAARVLMFLSEVKADAVIVKDIAVIYLIKKYFPDLEFHLSTQFGISNSYGIKQANELGASRAVLARELNYDEIKILNKPDFPKRELFVQGSMCFSFSGKCLMSSWFGGKSANRGSCQAPCRFKFSQNNSEEFNSPFSMKDLNLTERLNELNEQGISALKIEGRLKSAEWVGEITKIYRDLLDGKIADMEKIKLYSGREQGEGYYGGTANLIADKNFSYIKTEAKIETEAIQQVGQNKYNLKITILEDSIKFDILTDIENAELSVKLKSVKNDKRGIFISELEGRLTDVSYGNLFLNKFDLNEDIMISKSQLKNIISDLGSIIAPISRKEKKFLKNIKLPSEIENDLNSFSPDANNSLEINFANAKTLKIYADDIDSIFGGISNSSAGKVIVCEVSKKHIASIIALSKKIPVEISLFPILFEDDLNEATEIIHTLSDVKNISYEINDIGHLELLKNTKYIKNCGSSFPPYNSTAVKVLKNLGLNTVHIPFEADKEVLDGLKYSSLPLRMTIYSKIPLFYSRAESDNFNAKNTFSDRNGFKFAVRKYNDISIFLSEDYFTILGTDLFFIKASEFIIDLSGETDILNKFEVLKKDPSKFPGSNFNLNRRLH
ncbi:MAG: U32 family peptidase [Candidatus Delongbacteria bacterium]|nr:U32 family peptidase [Candidatus Delongbacteria bacterium]